MIQDAICLSVHILQGSYNELETWSCVNDCQLVKLTV